MRLLKFKGKVLAFPVMLIVTVIQEFWEKKRNRNIKHDKEITLRFESRGWTVIRIWECELKKKNREQLEKKLDPLIGS